MSMDLFVIRHAPPLAHSTGGSESGPPLSAEGRERWIRCVSGLDALGVRLDRILHSPLLRAAQTAEELAKLLDGESLVSPGLAEPPTDALLAEAAGAQSVAFVGHEPYVGMLVSILLMPRKGPSLVLPFQKGTVAWLRGEPRRGGMQLVAFLPPGVLSRVGPH